MDVKSYNSFNNDKSNIQQNAECESKIYLQMVYGKEIKRFPFSFYQSVRMNVCNIAASLNFYSVNKARKCEIFGEEGLFLYGNPGILSEI